MESWGCERWDGRIGGQNSGWEEIDYEGRLEVSVRARTVKLKNITTIQAVYCRYEVTLSRITFTPTFILSLATTAIPSNYQFKTLQCNQFWEKWTLFTIDSCYDNIRSYSWKLSTVGEEDILARVRHNQSVQRKVSIGIEKELLWCLASNQYYYIHKLYIHIHCITAEVEFTNFQGSRVYLSFLKVWLEPRFQEVAIHPESCFSIILTRVKI